jgi:site-specific recombinase XerD
MNFSDSTTAFLNGYFSTCRRSAKTYAAYQIDLKQLCEYLGPDTQLTSASADNLEKWALHLREQKYSSVSIRRKFATARVFFSYWVRKGDIEHSPLWKIRLDLGRERLLPRSISGPDAKLLIETAWAEVRNSEPCAAEKPGDPAVLKLRNLAAIETLFATGIRVGELVSVNFSDWNQTEASFLIKGKGSRQRLAFLPDERSVKAFTTYLDCRKGLSVDTDAVFLNPLGKRITTQGIARVIANMAESAGMQTHLTPHMLRHTVATLLLRFGADIRVVQEVLGHASIATTQRYTHVSKEHMLSTLRARHPSYHLAIDLTEKKAS